MSDSWITKFYLGQLKIDLQDRWKPSTETFFHRLNANNLILNNPFLNYKQFLNEDYFPQLLNTKCHGYLKLKHRMIQISFLTSLGIVLASFGQAACYRLGHWYLLSDFSIFPCRTIQFPSISIHFNVNLHLYIKYHFMSFLISSLS